MAKLLSFIVGYLQKATEYFTLIMMKFSMAFWVGGPIHQCSTEYLWQYIDGHLGMAMPTKSLNRMSS